ncbi:MAG: hypothetical protein ABIN36_10020 [Ferruginibacter sp.]
MIVKHRALKNNSGENCNWNVLIIVDKQGYNSFEIITNDFEIDNKTDLFGYFLGNDKLKFSIVDRLDGTSHWDITYKLSIPGKRTHWMRINYNSNLQQGTSSLFSLGFYTDENNMDNPY